MCKKMIHLVSLVLVLSFAYTSYADVVIGDFEGSMDGWALTWEGTSTIALSNIGATSGSQSLAVTAPTNAFSWAVMREGLVDLANYHTISADITWVASEWDPQSGIWVNFKELAINSDGPSGWAQYTPTDVVNPDYPGSWDPGWGDQTRTLTWDISGYDATGATWMQIIFSTNMGSVTTAGNYYIDNVKLIGGGATIPVDAGGDIAAANAAAVAGDTIEIAAGTFVLTGQIEIKDGVTYQGAGAGLTIIDGNNVTRAFVAWGDRGATNGQVDADGLSVPNTTGPKDWVLDGMTIQNCVADTVERRDILSAARDLLNNYTGTPYTLATAQGENGGVAENPGWFDILSGSADDNLTDVELQAYLDGNPVGSAGHLVLNDDKNRDGGAVFCGNGAVGTIQNCEFLNNSTPVDGDDGGAASVAGLSVVTMNDCLFDGNYACSPTSVSEEGADGDGGHIRAQGSTPVGGFITPGTTLICNRCVFLNGNAEDDGGAIQAAAQGIVVRLDACWFEANTSWDNGNVLSFPNEDQNEATVTNCVFVNNITKADNSPDRMIETRRNSKFINCTFVGNHQEDQDLIYNNASAADGDNDGVDDEMADTTEVVNCIFANNTFGSGANNDSILSCRNNDFTIAATNCLFFNNLKADGTSEMRIQNKGSETGSVLTDPLLDANYVPGAGSPVIDAGVDVSAEGVTTDYNGDPRPQGAAYDIGAYEVAAAPTNLVQNGGFDDASAWVILEHTVPAVTTIDPAFMDDAPSQGVAPCLRIASADTGESRPIVYQKLTLVAGQEYMVSSAIKILDATPASPSGTWFQIYMSPEEPDPVPEQTIDWNPPYKIFNIDAWGSNIADFIGFDGLFADGSQSFQVGDGTGLYVPPGEAGTEVDIFLVIKPGQCCRVGSYDVLFDNVSVYAK